MAGNPMICTTNNVDYSTLRKAMCQGVRSLEELIEQTGVCNQCEGCKTKVADILSSVCGCKGVSLAAVVAAVKDGATTVAAVGEITGAGVDCGRCTALIQNVIDLGR